MFSLEEINSLVIQLQDKMDYIDDSLSDLLDNIIKSRKEMSINVPLYDESVSEVRIGDYFKVTPLTGKIDLLDGATIKANSLEDIKLNCSYLSITDDTVISKKDFNNFLNNIKSNYFDKTEKEIVCKYNAGIASGEFSGNQIPSLKWFKNNYLFKDIETFNRFIFLNRSYDETNYRSAVTYEDVIENATINKLTNHIDVKVNTEVTLSDIRITPKSIAGVEKFTGTIELVNFNVKNANNYNSIVNYSLLEKILLNKNLSNLQNISIKTAESEDSLLAKEDLIEYLNSYKLLKRTIDAPSNYKINYITTKSIPQTPLSNIIAMFNEERTNSEDLIKNPEKYIDSLLNLGDGEQEPVTLTSVNALISLIAHQKSNNSLIVTNKVADAILEMKDELMESDDYQFKVPIKTNKGTDALTIGNMGDIFAW